MNDNVKNNSLWIRDVVQGGELTLTGTFGVCILIWLLFFIFLGMGESVWLLMRRQVTTPALMIHALVGYPLIGIIGGLAAGFLLTLYLYLTKKKCTINPLIIGNISLVIAWLFAVIMLHWFNVWGLRRIPFYSIKSIAFDIAISLVAIGMGLVSYYFLKKIPKTFVRAEESMSVGVRRLIFLIVAIACLSSFTASSLFRYYNRMQNLQIDDQIPTIKTIAQRGKVKLPNIILILIDALRADHLSCYGYQKEISPNIDQIAKEGVLFTNMIAQSSWTRPSVASIFTSLYPSAHGVYNDTQCLSVRYLTLAEALKRRGYTCAAFLGNNREISVAHNFDQGFDYFETFKEKERLIQQLTYPHILISVLNRLGFLKVGIDIDTSVSAADIDRKLLPWLRDHARELFFAYVHFIDPHGPYHSHSGNFLDIQPMMSLRNRDQLIKRYDGEILYLDEHLGKIFKHINDLGIEDRTLIIFIADHGEEFADHGGWSHGKTLYEEVLHIPLIMKYPGFEPMTISTPVQHIDIFPTILDFIGCKIPPVLEGESLIPLLDQGGKDMTRPIYSELGPIGRSNMRSIRLNNHKLIFTEMKGEGKLLWQKELYDLERDPGEKVNIYSKDYPRAVMMQRDLLNWIDYCIDHAIKNAQR